MVAALGVAPLLCPMVSSCCARSQVADQPRPGLFARSGRIGHCVGLSVVVASLAACGGASSGPHVTPTASAAPTSSPSASSPFLLSGQRIAFQANGLVKTVRPDGSDARVVVPEPTTQEHPDWSPDGTRLVFDAGFQSLWTVDADGAGATELFSCERTCANVQDGAWSPDGKEIAFMTAETVDGETTERSAILAVDVNSGSVRTITEDTAGKVWFFHPRWSPDGSELVVEKDTFASTLLDEESVSSTELLVVAANGRGSPRSIATGFTDPDWSAQNAIVAVQDGNLVTMQPDGSEQVSLTSSGDAADAAIQPTFTPDGEAIIFTWDGSPPTGAAISRDGANLTRLGGGILMTHPRVQPGL
jgi:Tol biopolymer transport system component